MRISDWSSDVCSSDLSLSERAVAFEAVERLGGSRRGFIDEPSTAMRRRENERFARRDSLVRQPLEIAQERRAAPSGVAGKGGRANEYHLIDQTGGLPLVELVPRRELTGHLLQPCLARPP